MRNFKNLRFWQRGHALTLRIYQLTNEFPKTETYGITSQIRRASSSVPTNIAEGCGRLSDAELARFMVIAQGSLLEVEYLILLCFDLKYISESEYKSLDKEINEIKSMMHAYHKKLISKKHPVKT